MCLSETSCLSYWWPDCDPSRPYLLWLFVPRDGCSFWPWQEPPAYAAPVEIPPVCRDERWHPTAQVCSRSSTWNRQAALRKSTSFNLGLYFKQGRECCGSQDMIESWKQGEINFQRKIISYPAHQADQKLLGSYAQRRMLLWVQLMYLEHPLRLFGDGAS